MTDSFAIEVVAPGRLQARGEMSFATAGAALQAGLALIPRGEERTVDLSQVTEADSAGLAVLVEWLATARVRSARIHYQGIPAQILAVARISDLDELLTDGH